ncbi:MAG: S-adenosylmethionine decarboxylase, partial [Gammaproteobacteria bacterium]|nr:S-adenosylmethionine decarboxylase [Gammaproteobacteria bacterium]
PPDGCTAFVMLDESHISIHTYADKQKMAIDIFISSGKQKCEKATSLLLSKLSIDTYECKMMERFE